jgi:hypothetical protein
MTFEQAEAQYLAEAPYSYGAWIGCDWDELQTSGASSWSESVTVDCADENVRGGKYGIWAQRVLTIETRTNYVIRIGAESGSIRRCATEDLATKPIEGDPALGDVPAVTEIFRTQYPYSLAAEGETNTLDLVPGRYELSVGFHEHQRGTVQVDIWPEP